MQPPKTAKYLLRFDDICPTMNWKVWAEIEAAMIEHRLSPMLAVVPDNRDPALLVDPPAKDFWDRVREWQARGWPIALHGFQHKYIARHSGIVTTRKKTEFAGVPFFVQEEKLRCGTEIFAREGIKPRLWIAPSNSFDTTTILLLPQFGINIISDGNFRFPFHWPWNIFWIPQQLFHFRHAPPGVWTVCYHHNNWTSSDLARFREDLRRFRDDIWSLDDVVLTWGGRRSWWSGFLCTSPRLSEPLIRAELKLWEWSLPKPHKPAPLKPSLQPVEQITTVH